MRVKKVIRKVFHRDDENVKVAGGVNAVVSANVNEPGSTTRASSRQRITQRAGKTEVETEEERDG